MTKTCRIVQFQEHLYAYEATSSPENALELEALLEAHKPAAPYGKWHPLIAAPFRYHLPVKPNFEARFKSPYSDIRVLYCAKEVRTTMYEHAYYFMRERIHLSPGDEAGARTLFSLYVNENKVKDILHHPQIKELTNRNSYKASHEYIQKNPEVKGVKYPSCRDPKKGLNYAIFDIKLIEKDIGEELTIQFVYKAGKRSLYWIENGIEIPWTTVK